MPSLDLYSALDITTRIVACGLALSALEQWSIRAHFGVQGVFSLRLVSPFHRGWFAFQIVDRYLSFLIGLQITASLGLAALGPFSVPGRPALVFSFLAAMLVRWRRGLGGDGAEQMSMLVLAAAGLAVLPVPSPDRVMLAVLFIAAQLGLSYAAAGIAKLVSPLWRSGKALPAILSTHTHGHPWAASFLQRHPGFAILASWSVILFECLFPLLVFGPGWMLAAALVTGLTFHLLCAVLMGLNSFLWSFPAVYACVIALWMAWK